MNVLESKQYGRNRQKIKEHTKTSMLRYFFLLYHLKYLAFSESLITHEIFNNGESFDVPDVLIACESLDEYDVIFFDESMIK